MNEKAKGELTIAGKDKVSVSLTYKVGLPNYGSADAQVAFASEVRDGETEEEAYQRVLGFVEAKIAEHKTKLDELANEDVSEPAPSKGLKSNKEQKTETAEPAPKKTGSLLGKFKNKQAEAPKEESTETEETQEAAASTTEEKSPEAPAPATEAKKSKLDEMRAQYKLKSGATTSSEESSEEEQSEEKEAPKKSSMLSKFKR